MTLFPKVKALLDKQGAKNILVLGGGIIPKKDKELLETKGVHGNFGPGTPLRVIIDYIKTKCNKNF